MAMTVELREINKDNWRECVRLKTSDEQARFVAPNLFPIAQSKVEPYLRPLAIYDDEEMIGFVMYGRDPADDCYSVARLMIDERHQGKGYGRAAMIEAIRRMRAEPDCQEIALSIEPENEVAEKLYASLGFRKTGEVIDGEVVMRLL